MLIKPINHHIAQKLHRKDIPPLSTESDEFLSWNNVPGFTDFTPPSVNNDHEINYRDFIKDLNKSLINLKKLKYLVQKSLQKLTDLDKISFL